MAMATHRSNQKREGPGGVIHVYFQGYNRPQAANRRRERKRSGWPWY